MLRVRDCTLKEILFGVSFLLSVQFSFKDRNVSSLIPKLIGPASAGLFLCIYLFLW